MSNEISRFTGVLTASLILAGAASAQNSTGANADRVTFDPRDLSGIWFTQHEDSGGYRSLTAERDVPPRTSWGEARFRTTVTGRTSDLGPGVPPVIGNDPIMQCNPEGYPRVVFFQRPVEIFHAGNRLLMHFEWQRALRVVWLDGRALPAEPQPAWYGHSVGRWEGDTLVIDSVGFDDRAWIDIYGNVHSDAMRLQEKWRRTGPDTLELVFRLDDPKTYTRPWVSKAKVFRRQTGFDLTEEICAPMDEMLFNRTIRDRAGAGDEAIAVVDDVMLERFANALVAIENIQTRAARDMAAAASERDAYDIDEAAKAQMLDAVSASGLSLEEYQRTADLVNADRDARDVVMQRMTEQFDRGE